MTANSQLAEQLPLFQMRDFDSLLNQSWPIGIDSEYPSELRVRLTAASLAFNAGNKSIDSFRKRYLADLEYPVSSADRLDKKAQRLVKDSLAQLDDALSGLEPATPLLGHMVSKWTFMRVSFSFNLAFTCAQRGALFECIAIVRMILEQVAWALDIRDLDDFRAITNRKAQQSLGAFRVAHTKAGRFYSWLSDHAHWSYDSHIKAFQYEDGKLGMRLAMPLYKAQSLAAIIVLFDIVQTAYLSLYRTLGRETSDLESVGVGFLLRELLALAPDDTDLLLLNTMLKDQES